MAGSNLRHITMISDKLIEIMAMELRTMHPQITTQLENYLRHRADLDQHHADMQHGIEQFNQLLELIQHSDYCPKDIESYSEFQQKD